MPNRIITLLCLAVALMLAFVSSGAHAAVMSIDYGTEWFKVGLIKPGIPLDVALNKDSKRKTQAMVTLREDQRVYGSDSLALAGRFPQSTFPNLKNLIGKPYDDKHCVEYRNRFVNNMISNPDRGTPLFHLDDKTDLTVEELIAYQFQNAREQARNTAGEDVKDVVITVTPFATQYERQAILDAAELAGLNVLSLIHDETAVALNYAVSREFSNTPEYHIFYDMGAGSTVASLVSFSNVKEGKSKKTVPQLEVKAVGFDRTLGGHEFDVRLRDLLADKFMQQHKPTSDIRQSNTAMARLLKEATRVKQILSANQETSASVESLFEDIDFKVKVTRAELENLCADLLDRVQGPIQAALEAAGMKVDNIKSLVLVGGSVRIPAVQRHLSQTVGADKIAKNVNGDEAAVLGAAFRGASLSNQFRLTKQIKIKDITVYPIEVTYQPEGPQDRKPIHTVLFNEFGTIGTRKIMTFKRESDFDFDLIYGKSVEQQDADLGMNQIAKVKVTGLTEALEKYQEDIKASEQPPKVKVAIDLTNSGLVSVAEASVSIQVKDPSSSTFSDKVKSFFGSKDEESSNEDDKEAPAQDQNKTEPENQDDKKAEDAKDKEPTMKKITLQVQVIPTGPPPMTQQEKMVAQNRIRELDALDEKRRLWEESRNNLESFVYRVQDFLYDDIVSIISTEEQQETLREQLSETSDWLYDEGESADTAVYLERLRKLQQLERPITFRRQEFIQRSDNIDKITSSVELARAFVDGIRSKTEEEERYHTDEELDSLLEHTDRLEKWKNDKVTAQEQLPNHVEPVFTTAETRRRCQELDDALMKLMRKKKPKAKKQQQQPPKNETSQEDEPTTHQENEKDDSTDEKPSSNNDEKQEEQRDHDEL